MTARTARRTSKKRSTCTVASSPATATACSAREPMPRTRCRRRWFGPGGTSTRSRVGPRSVRGSTGSPPTCASTCSGAESVGRRPMDLEGPSTADSPLGPDVGRARLGATRRRCPGASTAGHGPRRALRGPRLDPPGLRRRAPAPAGPPARRADPAGGAALAGGRGRRTVGHHGRLGQQRAATRPSHHGRGRFGGHRHRPGRPRAAGPARAATSSRVRGVRHRGARGA